MYSRNPVPPLTVWLLTLVFVALCVGAIGIAIILGVEITDILTLLAAVVPSAPPTAA